MNIELGSRNIAVKLRPLVKSGRKGIPAAGSHRTYLMVLSRVKGGRISCIRKDKEACLYLADSNGEGLLFERENAISEAMAQARAALN
jgi:hypothetical protein